MKADGACEPGMTSVRFVGLDEATCIRLRDAGVADILAQGGRVVLRQEPDGSWSSRGQDVQVKPAVKAASS